MTVRIEEQVRRYAEAVDSLAPAVEDLMPPEMLESLGTGEAPRVEVTLPLVAPKPRRAIPGWAIGLAAAALVLIIGIPLLAWISSGSDPAIEPVTTVPVETTVPFVPGPSTAVGLDIADLPRVNGSGWADGLVVRVSSDGGETYQDLGVTTSTGSFDFALPFQPLAGMDVVVEVGGSSTSSVIPAMSVESLDVDMNRVAGRTDLSVAASCCVSVFLFTGPEDPEAEEFPVNIESDGRWAAELNDEFDVTGATTVSVVYGDPTGLWVSWTHDEAFVPEGPAPARSFGPIRNPENGHYYEAVGETFDITWEEARARAEGRTFEGLAGHLATFGSIAEYEFAVEALPGAFVTGRGYNPYWIGAFQAPGEGEPAGGWQWVTGEPFDFLFWATDEPNNAGGFENCANAHSNFEDSPRWNDVPCDEPRVGGYIVEYDVEE